MLKRLINYVRGFFQKPKQNVDKRDVVLLANGVESVPLTKLNTTELCDDLMNAIAKNDEAEVARIRQMKRELRDQKNKDLGRENSAFKCGRLEGNVLVFQKNDGDIQGIHMVNERSE